MAMAAGCVFHIVRLPLPRFSVLFSGRATLCSLYVVLTIVSSASFFGFGTGYLFARSMRREFERYGFGRYRVVVAVLQLMGAAGQLVGLRYPLLGCLASAGLALMMLVAVVVRQQISDAVPRWVPAAAYLAGNTYLAFASMYR